MTRQRRRRKRLVIAGVLTVLLLAPLVWFWQASLLPGEYSVMDMGYADYGGGQPHGHGGPAAGGDDAGISVASLTGPADGEPDVSVTLEARREPIHLDGGPTVDGYTLNGSSPGPTIQATVGDLVEVRLVNTSVPDGVTLHWHGVDVPNAEDGVAGVTQDAVPTGGEHVYRFVAEDPGTYWYHSHQVSHEQVRGGLFGGLVIAPTTSGGEETVDALALVHTYDGHRTVNGRVGESSSVVAAGSTARVRVVNTNDGAIRAWVNGAPFRVVAVDGRDLVGPTPLSDVAVEVGGGGRVDLAVQLPEDGSAVRVGTGGGGATLVVGPEGSQAPAEESPEGDLDLMGYGSPSPLPFDPDDADRVFEYGIGRRPGFLGGRPGLWWTINGHLFPDVPMYMVAEGDVVRMEITNRSGEVHPMHLHGHHALVLSRDGRASTGSPLWVDSLNVADGESFEMVFVADNPGVWMDHCHNLEHAAQGLVAHLAYEGVTTPFTVGGEALNRPE